VFFFNGKNFFADKNFLPLQFKMQNERQKT